MQRWSGVDPTSDTPPFVGLLYAGPVTAPANPLNGRTTPEGGSRVQRDRCDIQSATGNDPSEGVIERRHPMESGFRCHFAHAAPGITQ